MLDTLVNTINSLRTEATSKDDKYAHIKEEELQKVVQYCDDAQKYLEERMEAYKARTKTSDPVFLSSDLKMRNDVYFLLGFSFFFCLPNFLRISTSIVKRF